MAKSLSGWYWRLGLVSLSAMGGAIAISGDCAHAQITPDGTLDKIKVNELSGVLQTAELSRDGALELLVLSACETAAGDARKGVGISGGCSAIGCPQYGSNPLASQR